jgi:hypothetical protein
MVHLIGQLSNREFEENVAACRSWAAFWPVRSPLRRHLSPPSCLGFVLTAGVWAGGGVVPAAVGAG